VIGLASPFVVVRRHSDGQKGSLEFTHQPHVYFGSRPADVSEPPQALRQIA
jgi:hypothetical protein